MFFQTRLNELRSQKALLLVQADAQRRLLALEAEGIVRVFRPAQSSFRALGDLKPWAWLLWPVAGFFFARWGRHAWRAGSSLFDFLRRVKHPGKS
jgi:hypothetical protein